MTLQVGARVIRVVSLGFRGLLLRSLFKAEVAFWDKLYFHAVPLCTCEGSYS